MRAEPEENNYFNFQLQFEIKETSHSLSCRHLKLSKQQSEQERNKNKENVY